MSLIPSNIRVPGAYVEIDESGANNGLPAYRQPLMIVAPRLKAPSVWVTATAYTVGQTVKPTTGNENNRYYICIVAGTSGGTEPAWPGAGGSVLDGSTLRWREVCDASKFIAVNTPTRIYSAAEAGEKAGTGSIAHRMARAAFRQYSDSEVYLNIVDDAVAGVNATATLVFTGTAVGQGSLTFRCPNDLVMLSWADGDTAAEVAAALDTLLAQYHDLPVTPSIATATVTLRAKNAGVPGNELGKYDSVAEKWEPEVVITGSGISCAVTGFASGANNPDITNALAAATSGVFALVAIPYKDSTNLAAIEAYMASEGDYNNCHGVRAWVATTDKIASATALGLENDKRLHVAIVRGCRFSSFELAAATAVMHAQTGHPALPLNSMEMVDCDAPDISDRFERTELNSLLWAGVTPFNADGFGAVRCVRSITTRTTTDGGSPDAFNLDTTTIANLDFSRAAIREADEAHFSQCVLRENHVDNEPSFVVTPDDIDSFHFAKCKQLERYGVMQLVDDYKTRFNSVRDPDVAGRVNSDIPVEVVQGLHVVANYIRIVTSLR